MFVKSEIERIQCLTLYFIPSLRKTKIKKLATCTVHVTNPDINCATCTILR